MALEVYRSAVLTGSSYPRPAWDSNALVACTGQAALTVSTAGRSSGYFLASLIPVGKSVGDGYLPFVVRDDNSLNSVLMQIPFTTYQAYNAWGGKSLYGGDDGVRANRVPCLLRSSVSGQRWHAIPRRRGLPTCRVAGEKWLPRDVCGEQRCPLEPCAHVPAHGHAERLPRRVVTVHAGQPQVVAGERSLRRDVVRPTRRVRMAANATVLQGNEFSGFGSSNTENAGGFWPRLNYESLGSVARWGWRGLGESDVQGGVV